MTNSDSWQQSYQDALLEVQPDRLRTLIEAAEAAILHRRQELESQAGNSEQERRAMDDALQNLRIISRKELGASPTVSEPNPRGGVLPA